VRADIAREVDAILKEKYGHLPQFDMADPLVVMERELNLSPSQKVRIGELFKQKQEEMIKAHDDSKMGEAFKKMREIDQRYEELVKAELDVAQQQKYEELKKNGKLMPGLMIKIGAKADDK
jgi:hypothetical protein